jgi:hypothetical protein
MVEYQIEVFDSEGRRSVLPENAPIERFAFFVGPDNMSPDVTHIPVVSISTITWPPVVTVEATDNLAIASVAVTWTLRDADGTQRGNGVFELVGTGGDSFQGPFPLGRSDVSDDSTIEYYIVATDAAQAANTKRHPLAGTHVTTVVSSGVLLSLDFEDAATSMVAGGRWERGVPAGPLSVAHSGVNTWATGLAAPYPATPQSSSLALPSFDLTGSNAKLIFWHWHDFEHRGDVAPGEDNSSASLWDGGNVKISVNGGTWSVAVPDGGYTGNLSASGGNPLAGQPVFGGYSFGWRREVISLPSAADVRVRFDFGTDSSNDETSVAFAGWYIDDVVVTTELPVDIESPVVEVRPPSRIVKPAATSATSLAARLVDDVGVDRVELVPEPGSKVVVPVQRFSMSFSDVDVYVLDVDLPEVMPGDWLSYRIRSVDFAGNEDLVPAPTEAPLVVDFRTVGTVSALTDAVGSGAWQRFGTTWRAGSALVGEGGSAVARSGLILAPLTVADNAEDVRLLITHSYQLDDASGGNVKVSSDDGSTWHVLDPDGGYGAIWLASSDHPMAGESVFRGVRSSAVDTFDVSDYVGIPIRLRIDGGYSPTSAPTSFWSVTDVSLETISEESEINVPLALALDANFPDPFATTTTLTYTLPQDDLVQVGVFDVLGRRVRVLLFQQQEAGVHTLQLEASGLADGMYFVQLNAGGLRATESVVVRR